MPRAQVKENLRVWGGGGSGSLWEDTAKQN